MEVTILRLDEIPMASCRERYRALCVVVTFDELPSQFCAASNDCRRRFVPP